MTEISRLLNAIDQGDPQAADQLLPLVYAELRRQAEILLAGERPGQTLQPTALVHEAYLRLVKCADAKPTYNNRRHFLATAAQAMRRILVDNARRKKRAIHGGELARRDLAEIDPPAPRPDPEDELILLDAAMNQLALENPQAAELVQLRHFGGLTLAEAAEVLAISPRSADRLWADARTYLRRLLQFVRD